MRKKLLVIVLVILGLVLLGTGIFFIQKYWRLYLKYKNFLGAQEVYYKLDILEGKQPQFKEWTFKKYLQLLKEGEEKGKKLIEEHEAALKALREDTVGGKTPEETLQGFVEALKKRDFDLASKYFWLDKQEEWKKGLIRTEEEGKIDEMISELENAPKIWEEKSIDNTSAVFSYKEHLEERTVKLPNGAGGFIETVLPAGEYKQEIRFLFNEFSNVWKIESF